jgi:hypothetical protein
MAKPFLWLMTSVIPVFIAACYGVPHGWGSDSGDGTNSDPEGTSAFLKGKVLDRAGNGISDIKVSCINGDPDAGATNEMSVYSMSEDGVFILEMPPGECDFLRAKDVDGEKNGNYKSKDVPVNDRKYIVITLEEKE